MNHKKQNLLNNNRGIAYIALILFGFTIFLLSGSPAYAGEKLKVAVYDFEAYGVPENVAQSATDLLRTELFRGGYFHVMERKQMEKILKEQKFQLSGAVAEEELINLGRILSVQLMAMGSMNRLGRKYIINLRLVDVEEGRLKAAETIEVSSEDEIHNGIKSLAKKIAEIIPVRGKVIKIQVDEVVVSLGSMDKIDKGAMLKVQRFGETFKDPSTGKELGRAITRVATLRVEEVIGEQLSKAKVVEESENIQVGDMVMIQMQSTPGPQKKGGSFWDKMRETSPGAAPATPSEPAVTDGQKKPVLPPPSF